MGGGSKSTWSLEGDYGVWAGAVANVSFLGAPGFCAVRTVSLPSLDASEYLAGGLVLTVRSTTPAYTGFKLRFSGPDVPRHVNQFDGSPSAPGSQAQPFNVLSSPNGEWQSIFVPFNGFSYDHSDYTGECFTKDPDGYQHRCCSSANPDVCPNSTQLETINSFTIMAEGVEGVFQMDVKEISAVSSAPSHAQVIVTRRQQWSSLSSFRAQSCVLVVLGGGRPKQ